MKSISVNTRTRTQFVDITAKVAEVVSEAGLQDGIVSVFVPHTTAGVTINDSKLYVYRMGEI
jgi:thiamine phosphate synthase YjbQ (UPF0047 family)